MVNIKHNYRLPIICHKHWHRLMTGKDQTPLFSPSVNG